MEQDDFEMHKDVEIDKRMEIAMSFQQNEIQLRGLEAKKSPSNIIQKGQNLNVYHGSALNPSHPHQSGSGHIVFQNSATSEYQIRVPAGTVSVAESPDVPGADNESINTTTTFVMETQTQELKKEEEEENKDKSQSRIKLDDITIHTPLGDDENDMDIVDDADNDVDADDVVLNSNDDSDEDVINVINEFMVVKDGSLKTKGSDNTIYTPLRSNEDETDIDADIDVEDPSDGKDHSDEQVISDINEFIVIKDGTLTTKEIDDRVEIGDGHAVRDEHR